MAAAQNVLAVIITKADSAYCERTVRSLFSQTLIPERVLIGVIGSDASPIRDLCARIEQPCPCDIHSVGKAATFFDAVNFLWQENKGEEEWLWLLHEDSAPEAHCLEALLESVKQRDNADTSGTARVGIVGPKQVEWDNPNKLLEVGIRATRSARRIPEIGQDEYDQGQYDHRREVLALGSAGTLIRRSALEKVGGFGGGLGPFGDGLELSRRMRAGGYEVIVCPEAKVRHKQESLGEDSRDSFGKRRKAQIFNGLITSPTLLFPFLLLFYLLWGFARALARLFTGKVRLAVAELSAPCAVFGSLRSLVRARRRFKKAAKGSRSRTVGVYEEHPFAIRTAQHTHRLASRDAASMDDVPDPLTEKALEERRRSARLYAWIILAVTGLATVLAHLPYFSIQATGGALLPDSSSFSQSMRTAASSWLASGDGYAVPSDIFWAFLSPFSLITSHLGVTATWIIFLAVVGAGLSAYIAAGDMTTSPPMRAVGAILWAFAPPLLDSVNAGHVAGTLAHICVPLVAMACIRAWKGSASALAAASVLFAFLAAASPMIVLVAAIVAIAGCIRRPQRRWLWLALPLPALVLLAPTLFALVRLSLTSLESTAPLSAPWRLLFSTPGMPLGTQTDPVSLLSFSPLGTFTFSQLAAFNIGALIRVLPLGIILVIAIMALIRPSHHRATRLGWFFIACGWAWALAASYVSVGVLTTPGSYTITHGWTGIALTCAFLGVWIVVLNMARTSPDDETDISLEPSEGEDSKTKKDTFARTFARIGISGATSLVAAASLLLGVLWVIDSFNGASLLSPAHSQAPALALADEDSAYHSRVLALDADENGSSLELWRGDGIELHETSMLSFLIRSDIATAPQETANTDGTDHEATLYAERANDDLAQALASLSGDSSHLPQVLSDHGVSVVLVPQETADSASRTLIGRLNSVRDLEYITANETGSFWRVRTGDDISISISRIRLDIGKESIAVPSGVFGAQTNLDSLVEKFEKNQKQAQKDKVTLPKQGRLVMAERADPYWHAQLITDTGTQELIASGDSWNQQWDIPLDVKGAEIVIYYGSPIQRIWPYIQLIVIVVATLGIFALPKRKRGRYE